MTMPRRKPTRPPAPSKAPAPRAVGSRCSALTKAGEPCPVSAMNGGTTCLVHTPEAAQRGRSAGGRAAMARNHLDAETALTAIDFRDRRSILSTLEGVARSAACGELDCRTVNAVIVAASASLQAHEALERAAKKNATDMTDEELDALIDAELEERRKAKETRQ